MILNWPQTTKIVAILFYCTALLCGRVTIDRFGLPMVSARIPLSIILLIISYTLIIPELLRTPAKKLSNDLCRNPFFWTGLAIVLAGSLTPAVTARGTIGSYIDFLAIAMFSIFPILAVTNRYFTLSISISIAAISLAIPILLLFKFGDISRDTMTSVISDFSLYRITIVGFSASLVAVYFSSSRPLKICMSLVGIALLYTSLYTDNKGAMLAVVFSTLGISTIAIALCASRFSIVISSCVLVSLLLGITLNPAAKADRWISVFNPNYLMEREALRRESAGDLDGSLVARKILEEAHQIENLVGESTYIYANDTTGRLRLWRDAIKNFGHHPILGSGFGSFASEVRGYYEVKPTLYRHPHNLFLEILAGGGLAGISILAISILVSMVFIIRKVVTADGANQKYIGLATLWAMLALLSGSMLNGDIYDARFLWALGPIFTTVTFRARSIES